MKSLKNFITESVVSEEDKYSCCAASFLWIAYQNVSSGKLNKTESEITKSLLLGVLTLMDDLGFLDDIDDFNEFELYLLNKILKQPSILTIMYNAFKSNSLYEDIDMVNGTQFIEDVLSDLYNGYLEQVIQDYLNN